MITRRGFNLVEVLVALGLVTVALLGVLSTQIYAARANQRLSQRQAAAAAAASLMARAEAEDFATDVSAARRPVPGQPGFEYQLTQQVNGRLKLLDLTVFYEDRGPQQFRLWTRALDTE